MGRARADWCALRPPRHALSTPSTCHCLGLFDGSRRRPRPLDLLRGASLPAPGAGALLAAVAAARTAARRSSSRTGLTRKRIGSSKSASSFGDRLLTQTIWRPGSRPRSSLASSRPAVSAGSSRRTSAVAVSALRRMTMGWWPRRATTAANSAAMSGSGSAIAIRAGDMAPRYPPPARPNPPDRVFASASASIASTRQPRRSSSTVSRPVPQPRSTANSPPFFAPAPAAKRAASGLLVGAEIVVYWLFGGWAVDF